MSENNTENHFPAKHHPGSKGTDVMNSKTKEELKDYRRTVIEAVRVLIGQGYSYEMKKRALAAQFQVSERMAKTYIKWFHEDFQKRKAETSERAYAIQKTKLELLYQLNMANGNLKEARETLKEIANLDDLNQKTNKFLVKAQVEVQNDTNSFTVDQLLQIENWYKSGHQQE